VAFRFASEAAFGRVFWGISKSAFPTPTEFLSMAALMYWFLCFTAAVCVGLSKSGFPGITLVTVALMAEAFPARASTGVLLPLLVFGDVCAVSAFRRHVIWGHILRMLPPTIVGVLIGFWLMKQVSEAQFRPVLGAMLLVTALIQTARMVFPRFSDLLPRGQVFAWVMGVWAGIATMLANAAGPVMALYFLALALPKENLVGTSAWFFLIVNVIKLPFSRALGLIHLDSLLLNLMLCPLVIVGTWTGSRLLRWIPQHLFERILIISAMAAALKMVF
jgi:hypothetical protein